MGQAVSAGDSDIVQQILDTSDPVKAKHLGSLVTPKEARLQNEESILKSIVLLKFKQNKNLGDRLKNSEATQFYECTRDLRWGTGIMLTSRQVDHHCSQAKTALAKFCQKSSLRSKYHTKETKSLWQNM